MISRPSAFRLYRALLAGLLILQLLCILALAARPAWHACIHPELVVCHAEDHDEGERPDHHDHECAVTLFLAGACDCAFAPVLAVGPALIACSDLQTGEVSSVVFAFRSRGIFEHAPPRSF